jgi:nicotinate-nucleotide adenylyltransferase
VNGLSGQDLSDMNDGVLDDRTWDYLTTPVQPGRPNRVALFGGTFNPIHYAHLAVAEQARAALDLDWVLFMPAGTPPQKTKVTEATDRARMVELAIADNPHFGLSRFELAHSGPSYTVDTLRELTMRLAVRQIPTELYFLISTETLVGLPTWHEAQDIPPLCRLLVTSRAGAARPSDGWLETHFPGQKERFIFIETMTGAYSSSDVRALVAAGSTVRYLVPTAVNDYLTSRGLYLPK